MLIARRQPARLRRRDPARPVSTIIEIVLSALLAPIMMLIQSGSVFQILLGRDTGWQPQRRDDGSIPFARHRPPSPLAHGARRSSRASPPSLIATSLFLWMSPTIVGLLLAIPLSWLSGQLSAGLALKRLGLLRDARGARAAGDRRCAPTRCRPAMRTSGFDDDDALRGALSRTPGCGSSTRRCCRRRRRAGAARSRPDRALAEAKLVDAETIEDALEWLKPKERMVVLHDRALLDLAMRLKPAPATAKQAAE